jgi:hypothetical protein
VPACSLTSKVVIKPTSSVTGMATILPPLWQLSQPALGPASFRVLKSYLFVMQRRMLQGVEDLRGFVMRSIVVWALLVGLRCSS